MIAIFYTEQELIDFSNQIQQFLIDNRNGYSATHWSDIDKSDSEEKWCVPIPEDYDNYNEKLDLDGIELIDTLPENWRSTEEL